VGYPVQEKDWISLFFSCSSFRF